MKAGLYLVATPIGNLGDVTLRALDVLNSADEIWAEDTRNARKLLGLLNVENPSARILACHDHNEAEMAARLAERVAEGARIAYLSDAGMPVISDPGFRLVEAAQAAGLYYTVLPGASAVPAALLLSGLPADRFAFLGFIPNKDGKRQAFFESLKTLQMTAIAFESPKRVKASLAQAMEVLGAEAEAALVREISKTFEEVLKGSLAKLNSELDDREIKGEIVLLFAPVEARALDDDAIKSALLDAMKSQKLNAAVKHVAQMHGLARNRVYDLALEMKDESDH